MLVTHPHITPLPSVQKWQLIHWATHSANRSETVASQNRTTVWKNTVTNRTNDKMQVLTFNLWSHRPHHYQNNRSVACAYFDANLLAKLLFKVYSISKGAIISECVTYKMLAMIRQMALVWGQLVYYFLFRANGVTMDGTIKTPKVESKQSSYTKILLFLLLQLDLPDTDVHPLHVCANRVCVWISGASIQCAEHNERLWYI